MTNRKKGIHDKISIRNIIILLILIAIIGIFVLNRTLSRYESKVEIGKDADIAFFVVKDTIQSAKIVIADTLVPGGAPTTYTFKVSNFNENNVRAEVALEYNIEITTTTNLPLTYTLSKNGEACATTENITKDEDGTYYKHISIDSQANNLKFGITQNETDEFAFTATFPKTYTNGETNIDFQKETQYADKIDVMDVSLTATQIIEE